MVAYREDLPIEVRSGERLDRRRLQTYLGTLFEGACILAIEQFPSGFSNLTYRVLTRVDGADRDFVLRRPPYGSTVRSAHDMGREYRILTSLSGVYDKAPRPVDYCGDDTVLGAPFYLMERIRGLILRGETRPKDAPRPAVMRDVALSFVGALADLHSLDYRALGLADLGKPVGYIRRQVEGWLGRYERAKTDAIPDLDRASEWLTARIDAESGAALVHNDFKYDNLVLDLDDPSRVLAVLDWEMATIGDPLLDLGTTLAYWVDPDDPEPLRSLGLTPTTLPGNPRRVEVAELYAKRRPLDEDRLVFAYVFGLIKIAVIAQQIYCRFKSGSTGDPRFAKLIHAVRALGWGASRAIELGRIDRL